jgi:hypothetical protein
MNTTEEKTHQEAYILATNGEYPPMVRFKYATDNVHALAYAYLTSVEYDKSGVVTLEFASHKVVIKGRRLDALFGSLVNHQVISVRQQSITDLRPPAGECCIDALVIKESDR